MYILCKQVVFKYTIYKHITKLNPKLNKLTKVNGNINNYKASIDIIYLYIIIDI